VGNLATDLVEYHPFDLTDFLVIGSDTAVPSTLSLSIKEVVSLDSRVAAAVVMRVFSMAPDSFAQATILKTPLR